MREESAGMILDLSLSHTHTVRQQGTGTWSGSVPLVELIIEQEAVELLITEQF